MILKAHSTTDNSNCYLNSEYIIDVFVDNNKYIAYTVDNERGGYSISEDDFKKWMDYENDVKTSQELNVNFIPDDIMLDDIEQEDVDKATTGFQILSQLSDDKDEV